MKNTIEQRFDAEYKAWEKRYQHPYKDVVSHEIATRKRLIDGFLDDDKRKSIKIIEIGCGMANVISDIVKKHDDWKGYGIDISENMIEYNKEKFPHIQFDKVDLNNEEIWENEKFDIVICAGVIGYLDDPTAVLKKINRALNDDGVLLISYGNKRSIFRILRSSLIKMLRFRVFNSIIKRLRPNTNSFQALSIYKNYSSKEFKSFMNGFGIVEKRNYSFCAGLLPGIWVLQTKLFELITANKYGPGRDILLKAKKKG